MRSKRDAIGGIPRYRSWDGPAVLSAGFRPFFFLAGLWATVAVAAWLALLLGNVTVPTAFDPVTWHAHEMLFGFVLASVAGFLFTAIPNWTGRMPIQGWSLGALAALFCAGRVAVTFSAELGPAAAAVIDLAFSLALVMALAREVVAGRNWRNLPMIAAVALLTVANGLTHLEAVGWAATGQLGLRLGIAVIVALIALVGGRIIPSFTRNWLVKRGDQGLPAPVGRFDTITLAVTVAALCSWTVAPEAAPVPALMALAAAMTFIRLARWRGFRTGMEPLVWSLHIGYLWLPIGFALIALAGIAPDDVNPSAALHALTGGAMATMILAVSTRATLGHTGRDLRAGRSTVAIYVLATVSATARVAAGLWEQAYLPMLVIAGTAWLGAFAVFLAVYGRILFGPRAARVR